jgi:hypothetical protein
MLSAIIAVTLILKDKEDEYLLPVLVVMFFEILFELLVITDILK